MNQCFHITKSCKVDDYKSHSARERVARERVAEGSFSTGLKAGPGDWPSLVPKSTLASELQDH